jgi:acetylornithine deacetylase/succinyl-diaminopimelate desuccinylase-like protein
MSEAAKAHYPDAELVGAMIVGLTDARFFRQKGAVAYGAGLMSTALSGADFSSRFHGNNERVDIESLRLTTDFFARVLDRFWTP